MSLLLAMVILLFATPSAQALGWGRAQDSKGQGASLGTGSSRSLQEVAPPPAVQQMQPLLARHQPQLRIVAPAADSLVPPGPVAVRVDLQDWPLVDAGPLGLGPHLVAQLDDGTPQRITQTSFSLPELSPGSHRLTVYAAKPWGEAVKAPGALQQIRLHRTAANPLQQPAPGSPQLLLSSPPAQAAGQPLLFDWLLLDAPLQHLREGDERWRLRLTLNGDSVLLDRLTPLWLRGWRGGSNALSLELVDPHGDPLNPPFNALVREVQLQEDNNHSSRWLGPALNAQELAVLLGDAPAASLSPAAPQAERLGQRDSADGSAQDLAQEAAGAGTRGEGTGGAGPTGDGRGGSGTDAGGDAPGDAASAMATRTAAAAQNAPPDGEPTADKNDTKDAAQRQTATAPMGADPAPGSAEHGAVTPEPQAVPPVTDGRGGDTATHPLPDSSASRDPGDPPADPAAPTPPPLGTPPRATAPPAGDELETPSQVKANRKAAETAPADAPPTDSGPNSRAPEETQAPTPSNGTATSTSEDETVITTDTAGELAVAGGPGAGGWEGEETDPDAAQPDPPPTTRTATELDPNIPQPERIDIPDPLGSLPSRKDAVDGTSPRQAVTALDRTGATATTPRP